MENLIRLTTFLVLIEMSFSKTCTFPWKFSYGNSCYYLGSRPELTWNEARLECLFYGGYLAILDTHQEDNYTTYAVAKNGNYWFWIGGTDFSHEGTFHWDHTGKPISYSDWSQGEPNGNFNENCIVKNGIVRSKSWHTLSCDTMTAYLCEKS